MSDDVIGRLVPAEEFALELLDSCVHPLQGSLNVERATALIAADRRAVVEATLEPLLVLIDQELSDTDARLSRREHVSLTKMGRHDALTELRSAITAARGENQPKE